MVAISFVLPPEDQYCPGGAAWFEIEATGTIRHNFSPELNQRFNTIDLYLKHPFWWHTYYLETLRSINNSLQ